MAGFGHHAADARCGWQALDGEDESLGELQGVELESCAM
jgi:hypothetical protein